METKKISFGFSKVKKVEKVVKEEEKKDFIKCLEDKSIKVFGGDAVKEEKPLVIPMTKNTKPSLEALARIAQEVESENVEVPAEEPSVKLEPKEGETLEERAAREIINESKNVKTEENKVYSLPIAQSNQVEGKEATIEEYENIPITEFGLAMLRGMGWAPGKGVGKKETNVPVAQPQPRPKGLGLGADRVVKPPTDTKNKNSKGQTEELKMVKGAFVKISNGSNAGSFGQISGFDEDSGRIIVELAVKKTAINISEFMVQLVSKQEYQDQSRIINSSKLEEYKIKENGLKYAQRNSSKSESKHSNRSRHNSPEPTITSRKDGYHKDQRDHSDQRDNRHKHDRRDQRHKDDQRYYKDDCDQRDLRDLNKDESANSKLKSKSYTRHSSSEEENTKYSKNRHERKDPSDSDSDSDDSRHRSRKRYEDKKEVRNSSSSPEVQKKDKDKKRKGKKKRRDRSRSPNYRKYKK